MDIGNKSTVYSNKRFKLENKDSGFQARSPIIHISVIDNMLYCSTLKDSLCLIQFNPETNTFQALVSDPRPRLSTFHYAMSNQIIVADKCGDLVGLAGECKFPLFNRC
jgi:hypothetical protein